MRIMTILTGGLVPLALAGTAIAAPNHGTRGDLDADGQITRAELDASLERRFQAIDTNGDNQLDEAERQAAREQHRSRRAERREARSGDRRAKRGGERRGAMRTRIDANSDGIVSRAEFGARALQRFARADANSDGVVTAEERAAMQEARKARRN